MICQSNCSKKEDQCPVRIENIGSVKGQDTLEVALIIVQGIMGAMFFFMSNKWNMLFSCCCHLS